MNIDPQEMTDVIKDLNLIQNIEELDEAEIQNQFDYFIAKYKKNYLNNAEHSQRYGIFKENLMYIQNHNQLSEVLGFALGVNKFADLTNEEFQNTYLGLGSKHRDYAFHDYSDEETEDNLFTESRTEAAIRNLEIPGSIDWVRKGAVTSVKDQGKCGSCWAFSAVAAIEGANYITRKKTEELSQQQFLDCAEDEYHCSGCNGGFPHGAFEYAIDNDICADKDYPYTEDAGRCTAWWSCSTDNYVEHYTNVTSGSRYELYSALAKQPVSIGVDASSKEFQFYASGILGTGCDEQVNHAVTAVGYSYESFYFFWQNNFILVKNSWGSDWGEKGYIRLGSNDESGNGMCGAYLYGTYPTVRK